MKYLLDTCVISETSKPRPDPAVIAWLTSVDEADLFVPAVVMGELRNGLITLDEGRKKRAIAEWLEDYHRFYSDKIVPFDLKIADIWGDLTGRLEKAGRTAPVIDSQIAATALAYDMTLVTRNIKDMVRTGARLFNPFSPDPPKKTTRHSKAS